MSVIIYAGSHRAKGNTDRAAALLKHGVEQAGGVAQIMTIREYDILPCTACGVCDTTSFQGRRRCVLGHQDSAWELFAPLFTAKAAIFAAPIYFYNLPSAFKTWIDRGQQFWIARQKKEAWLTQLMPRRAYAVMVAGRPRGEKLFDGSTLTLRYFAQMFNMDLVAPLTFHGIDQQHDLLAQSEYEDQIQTLGSQAWKELA